MRDVRVSAYHSFEREQNWRVLGLHQDLSRNYPVKPLLGAVSAQAELALTGDWDGWSAVVASVLVRSGESIQDRRHHDVVVQLTALDTGPLSVQFTAAYLIGGLELAMLNRADDDGAADVERLLEISAGRGALVPGDRVAANEVQLLHTRRLDDRDRHVDIAGPLILLADLARASRG